MIVATQKIAWLAGLFEGEGCWGWDGEKIAIRLTSCDKDVIQQAKEWSGIGTITGPIAPSGFGKKDRWEWSVSNTTDAYAVFLGIEPYLRERRRTRFLEVLAAWSRANGPRKKITRVEEWEIRKAKGWSGELPILRQRFAISIIRVAQIRKRHWSCYISGKMRGLPEHGFPLFDAARDTLTAQGWNVVSPADLDRQTGFEPDSSGYDFHIIRALKRDFDEVKKVDAIVLLPNWTDSIGAKAEKLVAERFGRKVFYYDNGQLKEES